MIRINRWETVTALVLITLLGTAATSHGQADQAAAALRAETELTLARLRADVEQAEQRWRQEFVGKLRARGGAPVPEPEVLAEVRRASQTIAGATTRMQTLTAVEMDALVEEALSTTWDIHLTEARRATALAQEQVNAATDELQARWSRILGDIGNRPGLTPDGRQQLIDVAAPSIREAERQQLDAAASQLDAVARRLTVARQTILDLVTARIASAREAKRMTAAGSLDGFVEAHLESVGPDPGVAASSFDQLLAAAQLHVPTVVIRGQPQRLALADRIRPMLAGPRLAIDDEPEVWYPEPPVRSSQIVLKVETFYPGRLAQATWRDVLGDEVSAGWGSDDRLLVVYGFNLFEYGRPAFIDASDPEIGYTVLDITREHPDATVTPAFEPAWSSAQRRWMSVDGPIADALREADAALVRARLRPGAAAGLKRFRLSLLDVEWLEETGNVVADVAFVRQLGPEEAEPLDTIFLHDRFRVRAVVNARTSLDELEAVLLRDGKPWEIDGQKTLRLTRAPYDPRVYHSETIRVVPGGGAVPAAGVIDQVLPPNTRLMAVIPRLAPVKMRTPANAQVQTTPNQVGALWKDWLFRAATVAGRSITDFDTQSEEILGAIPHFHLTTPNRKIEIQLGDYAAMLMLREAYLREMRPLRDEFRRLHASVATDPEALQSFYELARVAMIDPNHPLGGIPVTETASLGPLTRRVPFRMAYDGAYLNSRAWLADGQREWVRRVTREAFDYYVAALDTAVRTAEEVDPRNLIDLLELTGTGFAEIAARLRPHMLRLREGPEGFTWEPDPIARSRLAGIRSLGAEHNANRELSKAESDVVLTAASLVCFAPNYVALRAASLAMSITFVEKAFLVDLPAYFQSRADLAFATGAYTVLGPERMAVAEANQVPAFTTALSVIGSTVGLGADFAKFVQVFRASEAAAAVPGIVGRIKNGGLAEFGRLSTQQKAAYAAALGSARVAERTYGVNAAVLTATERELLAVEQLLLPRLRFVERWRTYHVGAATRDRILHRAAMNEPAPNLPEPAPAPAAAAKPAPKPPADTPEIATARTNGELLPPPRPKALPRSFPGEAGGVLRLPTGEVIAVGVRRGAGLHAVVYEIDRDTAQRLANWLDPGEQLPSGEYVIKLMMGGNEKGRAVVERQQLVQNLLTEHDIPNLRLVGGETGGAVPFVVQQRIPPGARTYDYQAARRANTDWGLDDVDVDLYAYVRGGPLPQEIQEAVLRFNRGIADKNVILEDGHLGNFCFRQNGEVWEAIVLDHERFIRWSDDFTADRYGLFDRISLVEGMEPGFAAKGLGQRATRIHSIDWATMPPNHDELIGQGQHVWPSPQFFMAKMLEYDGRYIRFNPTTGQWTGKHLDIDLVRKYFPELDAWRSVRPQ